MMIYNPHNGTTVRNIWIYDKLYFSDKAQEEFNPGEIVQIGDKAGSYLIELIGFLREVSAIEAENIVKKRGEEKFFCDHPSCGYEAKNKQGLMAHKRVHQSSVEGVKLAIPVESEVEEKIDVPDSIQDSIEQQAKASGLIGEGLVEEHV